MTSLLLSSFFLYLFGCFNLLGIKPALLFNQLIYGLIGLTIFLIIKKINRPFFQTNNKIFYWFLIIVLIITFILGFEVKGSKRWLDFYFFKFQASEFFKIIFILFISDFLTKNKIKINNISTFIKSIIYFLLPVIIIFKQPDLGNALVIFFIYIILLLFSKIPKKYILYMFFTILLMIPFSWLLLKDYQKNRLLSFFNPNLDQAGISYNMIQSIITVGSGKIFGRGLGLGTQSRLLFLPENHTDFAYSSLVEQFGFFGGLLVIILYAVIAFNLFKRLANIFYKTDEQDAFDFYYTTGFLSYFIFQVFINIGMNMGVMPIAGIALPLISFGGSSIVSWMIGLALLP